MKLTKFYTCGPDNRIVIVDPALAMFDGKRLEITVTKAKSRRSLNQNSFLWGIVYPCALKGFHDLGYLDWSVEDVHKFFRDEYSTECVELFNPNTGEVKAARKTTTTMTKSQMMFFIEQIAKFCSEWFCITIPEPTPLFSNADEQT